MSVHVCPRCQRANPEMAVFCYFDGAELRPNYDGAAAPPINRLLQEFVFPSGRRCKTYDEFADGCQAEWPVARDLLRKGVFNQFFMANGRADLVKAAQDSLGQPDADIGLHRFLSALPIIRPNAPRLDLNPRRLLLGHLTPGESRKVQLTVSNQGKGVLQGTLKVTEGGQWLKLADGSGNGQCTLNTPREQQVILQVDTLGLPAAQTYGGKLTVITNGGVVEVPVRMDLVAHPFAKAPFQGAKTPREMAERMRNQPKAAGPLLESGEIGRWFASNGWNYPIRGGSIRGVAGVQQFFEAMGLSKPPVVQISQPEIHFTCVYPNPVRFQIALHTSSRKWVYGNVESDSPWLKVLTPQVSGPQQTAVAFEVDSSLLAGKRQAEGILNIVANGGQTLKVRVGGEVRGAPRPKGSGFLRPVITMALAFFLLRLVLIPVADLRARGAAAHAAGNRLLGSGPDLSIEDLKKIKVDQFIKDKKDKPAPSGASLDRVGGWLGLPWVEIYTKSEGSLPGAFFKEGSGGAIPISEFRHYFISYFARSFVFWLWWIGAVLGMLKMWKRREGFQDLFWGLIAGAGVGVAASATLACLVLVMEFLPQWLMEHLWKGEPGLVELILWIIIGLVYWTLAGAILGLACGLVGGLRRTLLAPVQATLAALCRLFRLHGPATYFAPS